MLSALLGLALVLQELPTQKLAPGRCVAFLWSRTMAPARIAMIDQTDNILRLRIDGKTVDLAQQSLGVYARPGLTVRVTLDLGERSGLSQGMVIDRGSLRIEPDGEDSQVLPVGGLSACK